MQPKINQELFEKLKSHYFEGCFDIINVTFHHLGCEILYNKKDKDFDYQYNPSSALNFSVFQFVNNKIGQNCCLELYTDENNQFKIDLILIVKHELEEIESIKINSIIDKYVLEYFSTILGREITIEQIYLSLHLYGSNKIRSENFDFNICFDEEDEKITFESEKINPDVKERILNKIINLVENKLGHFADNYQYTFSIDEDNCVSLIEDCFIGAITQE